jgi:hypothetical protein
MRVQGVDFAQIVFDVDLTRTRPQTPFEYKHDGYFIQQLYEELPNEFVFIPQTLCYYNRLTNLRDQNV